MPVVLSTAYVPLSDDRRQERLSIPALDDSQEAPFANAIWDALHTRHRHFAQSAGGACRYPREVAPFAALAVPGRGELRDLHSLLAPGEAVWLLGARYPAVDGLSVDDTLECLQMLLPMRISVPTPARQPRAGSTAVASMTRLTRDDAVRMVALTDIAFPGFFRSHTCEMGTYYGMHAEGDLVAMGGERLRLEGYSEISGICTHPSYRGRGFAQSIVSQLVHEHRRDGVRSWLHVGAKNEGAIKLYRGLGFEVVRTALLTQLRRTE